MAVLITGGAGYIGSHMALEMLDAGEPCVVLDDLSTGFHSAVPQQAKLIVGDFGSTDLVSNVLSAYEISAILHFAAKVVVPDSLADPLTYYWNNTAKTRNLIACAVQKRIPHFIFSSTAAVYGDPARNPVPEEERPSPLSPYGRSKLMVEWMLADAAAAHNLHYVVLRYFNVAGADPLGRSGQSTLNATHLIKVAVQTALGIRPAIEVFGADYPTPDGSCVRDYIQVTDLVRAHRVALEYLRAGGESLTCNCGYSKGYSVFDVINVVKRISGVDFPVKVTGRRPGDSASVVADNTRIKASLGWRPAHDSLEAIVHQSLRWERHLRQGSVQPDQISAL